MTILDLTADSCEHIALQLQFDFISLANLAMTCQQMCNAARLVQGMLKQRKNGMHASCSIMFNRKYYKVDSNAVQHAVYAKILTVPSIEALQLITVSNKSSEYWPVDQIHPPQVWVINGRSLHSKPAPLWFIRIGIENMLTQSDDINILRPIPRSVCKKLVSKWSNDPLWRDHPLLGELKPLNDTESPPLFLNPVVMKWEALLSFFPKTLLKQEFVQEDEEDDDDEELSDDEDEDEDSDDSLPEGDESSYELGMLFMAGYYS